MLTTSENVTFAHKKKKNSVSKNNRGISFSVLKVSVVIMYRILCKADGNTTYQTKFRYDKCFHSIKIYIENTYIVLSYIKNI